MYINMKKKTILLLHGFKRNGVDDFEQLHDYFSQYKNEYEIINETYFDNYDKKTLTDKYLNKKVDSIAERLKDKEQVIFMGYSTGSIIAAMVADRLPKTVDYYIWAMVPPIKIVLMKWVPMGYRIWKKEKVLKKKMGNERYEALKSKAQANKTIEKYPVTISKYINVLRKKYQKLLLRQKNTSYLLAKDDKFVHTPRIIKKLNKYNRDYEILIFSHNLLLNRDKQIFIEWFEKKIKDHK